MIKRTLYFGNPAYLSMQNQQLVLRLPEIDKNASLPLLFKKQIEASVPIEDIGMVVIDHRQITLTHDLCETLIDNNSEYTFFWFFNFLPSFSRGGGEILT